MFPHSWFSHAIFPCFLILFRNLTSLNIYYFLSRAISVAKLCIAPRGARCGSGLTLQPLSTGHCRASTRRQLAAHSPQWDGERIGKVAAWPHVGWDRDTLHPFGQPGPPVLAVSPPGSWCTPAPRRQGRMKSCKGLSSVRPLLGNNWTAVCYHPYFHQKYKSEHHMIFCKER